MTMTDITFTQAELDEFGAKLESVLAELTAEEQLLLEALVAKGIERARDEAEDVSGFLLPAVRQLPAVQLTCDGSVRPGQSPALKLVGDPFAARGIIAVLKM